MMKVTENISWVDSFLFGSRAAVKRGSYKHEASSVNLLLAQHIFGSENL
jgi:hypothetical protein